MDMNNDTRRKQARHLYLSARTHGNPALRLREIGGDAVHVASNGGADDYTNITDTLANIHHYADAVGVSWAVALGGAGEHYRAERAAEAREAAAEVLEGREVIGVDGALGLSDEAREAIGVLVADQSGTDDGDGRTAAERLTLDDGVWAEIREAFPLPEARWDAAAIAKALESIDPRQTFTVLGQAVDVVGVGDEEEEQGYVFRGTFYADAADAADSVLVWDAELGN